MTPISDEFAEYALNLAATNIVLLVGRGKGFTAVITYALKI